MDEELKTFLVGMETRLTSRVEQQLTASEGRTAEQIKASEARTGEQIKASEARMVELIRDTETKLLREFWKWGRTSDQKIRRIESSDAITVERMSALEDRVFTLERKIAGSPE